MKKLLLATLVSVAFSGQVAAQSAIVRGEASPGVYETIQSVSQALKVTGTVTSTPSGTQTVTGTVTLGAGSAAVGTVTANPGTSQLATYRAASPATAMAASATDICTLTGSATKTIKVTRIIISGFQTTASYTAFVIAKRSTANTGGTSGAITALPLDSSSGAATGTVLAYTANPTLGSLVANVEHTIVAIPALAATLSTNPYVFSFGTGLAQPLVLRGIAQVVAVNNNGSTVTGGNLFCTFEWTEE